MSILIQEFLTSTPMEGLIRLHQGDVQHKEYYMTYPSYVEQFNENHDASDLEAIYRDLRRRRTASKCVDIPEEDGGTKHYDTRSVT
jgi:hypothetical protein